MTKNQRDKYVKTNHSMKENKRQQSTLLAFFLKSVSSSFEFVLFNYLCFSFGLPSDAAICKYGHEFVLGNLQVFVCGFKIIVYSNLFFLCLHFFRHLHTKSCSARISSQNKRERIENEITTT